MKFIIWTVCYFGLIELMEWMSFKKGDYTPRRGLPALTLLFIIVVELFGYIFLYNHFIK